MLLMPTSITL